MWADDSGDSDDFDKFDDTDDSGDSDASDVSDGFDDIRGKSLLELWGTTATLNLCLIYFKIPWALEANHS